MRRGHDRDEAGDRRGRASAFAAMGWLVLGALVSGCAADYDDVNGAPSQASPAATGPATIEVAGTDALQFDPPVLNVSAGRSTLRLSDAGSIPHTLVISSLGVRLAVSAEGASDSVDADLVPGSYAYICDIPGHLSAGMQGTLIVSAADVQVPGSTTAPPTTVPPTTVPPTTVPPATAPPNTVASTTTADGSEPSTSTIEVPPSAAAQWSSAGADLDNSRSATGSAISSSNVATLAPRWFRQLPGFGSLTTVPIVVGDVIYLAGGSGAVTAIDRETGAELWTSPASGFNIGPFGVAVDDERVYAIDGSTGVRALDRSSGAELWSTVLAASPTTGIDIQPIVVDGLVIVSTVPISIGGIYTPGDHGVVSALDAATGRVRWSFDTVEAGLWGHPEVNSGGGAWYSPAVDLERGLLYVGVANPAPFPGTTEFPNGTSRPGDNLYTDSLVALDLHTGALKWYDQVTPHDLFDRDQIHALIARVPGGDDVVVSAGKSGVVVGVDPDTGKEMWRTEVGRHDNDDLASLDGPTTVSPGTYGGILTPPATADGVVYVATINAPVQLLPDEVAYFGAEFDQADGDVVAVDAATGEVLWSTPVPGDPLGGATVVGDLVFTALLDGTIVALDRSRGDIVWRYSAPGGINGWMAVDDDQLLVPVGLANPGLLLSIGLSEQ